MLSELKSAIIHWNCWKSMILWLFKNFRKCNRPQKRGRCKLKSKIECDGWKTEQRRKAEKYYGFGKTLSSWTHTVTSGASLKACRISISLCCDFFVREFRWLFHLVRFEVRVVRLIESMRDFTRGFGYIVNEQSVFGVPSLFRSSDNFHLFRLSANHHDATNFIANQTTG